jgi:CHAT domain
MNEFRIDITPENGQLRLQIKAPTFGANAKTFHRVIPTVTAEDLDELRGGAPDPVIVRQVKRTLSEWLETPDFDLIRDLGLLLPNAEELRWVFSVRDVTDQMLRANLTDLPFELIAPSVDLDNPLALNPLITSIVHVLPKQSEPPLAASRSWPLRILIVRSNPQELQQLGMVPTAAEIRQKIRDLRPDLGPDLLRIDVLSSEAAADIIGRPTKNDLFEQIEAGYDILVYLGHGDMRPTHADQFPVGELQLETNDGVHADRLDAPTLSTLLVANPMPVVPVVLLIGCLTAAQGLSDEVLDVLEEEIPAWMSGSRAVAQALIDGQSGVQFVVGMRFRIEVQAATLFLEEFFKSLLGQPSPNATNMTVGNLERAVRQARRKLRVTLNSQDLSWAAPLVFRTLREEPMFPFLASTPVCPVLPQEAARVVFWTPLATSTASERTAGQNSMYANALIAASSADQELIAAHTQQNRPVIMPNLQVIAAEGMPAAPSLTRASVLISLRGSLNVNSVEGSLSVTGEEPASIVRIDDVSAAALQGAGYRLMAGAAQGNSIVFKVERKSGNAPLPEGPLFAVEIEVGVTTQRIYTLSLENVKTDPLLTVCTSSNALIVPQR